MKMIQSFKWLVFSVSVFALMACQSSFLESVQKVTYEPEFHYISKAKWASTMRKFETYNTILENNLSSGSMTEDQRIASLSVLGKMDRLTVKLSQETLSSHLNFSLFRQGIKIAQAELKQTPPVYQQVHVISSYCASCHAEKKN
ncbi:MAG: hypothetical protein ISR69_00355 [Gammaproteobacteria bacterium]|nr:hypothetical protein [Candidatus Brocadiales bacterium]MBL7002459.1 hypothetical protein [Gammaproteobacteria bacterium]